PTAPHNKNPAPLPTPAPTVQSSPTSPRLPSIDWPKWFSAAYEDISKIDLGGEYAQALSLLVELETLYGFKNKTRGLSKNGRPAQLDRWIANGRGRGNKPPLVTNVQTYSDTFWTWWKGLQPSWRTLGEDSRPVKPCHYGDDWGELDTPGANGMLSPIACVYWWGCAVLGKVDGVVVQGTEKDWKDALLDVTWTLDALIHNAHDIE
ncbi:hypothetical protein BJ138DRAFT_1018422, partial [Hygrophoropsis aurantiaca]